MRRILKKKRIHQIRQTGRAETLAELRQGESGILSQLALPDDVAQRLMELGFVPGSRIEASHKAPGGDPRVFRVDGTEIALRRETAEALKLQISPTEVVLPEGS